MKRRHSTSSAIAAVLIAAVGSTAPVPAAWAQNEPAKSDPAKGEAAKPADPAKPDGAPTKPAAPSPAGGSGTSAVVVDLSAIESVIGKSVKSSTGEDLGRIVDLLVTTSGQVRAAVIDFGGILGVGSRKVAVDWRALDFSNFTKDGTVRLALTRNQVRVSPEYKTGDPVVILQAGKPEEPKPEAPKPEAPKPEAPKPEAPKPEGRQPAGPTGQDPQAAPKQAAPGEVSPPKGEEHK